MLKLRYLEDNRPLAEALRAHWDADPAPFEWYRISANAVYPFSFNGGRRFLRFVPATEKQRDQVIAELDFLSYLDAAGYGAARPIPARDGRLLVGASTLWGDYLATAFEAVPGTQLSRTDLSDEIVAAWGRGLAELHRLSAAYTPPGPLRWSHADVLNWVRVTLAGDAAGLAEAELVDRTLKAFPKATATYGLVHYDFECDNVFFDAATDRCWGIDFDDCMYHWYAMDIEQALASLADEIDPALFPARQSSFLSAYAAIRPLPEDFDAIRSACQRFAALYWYARVVRSLAETLPDEPDWMIDLRARLGEGLATRAAAFGSPL